MDIQCGIMSMPFQNIRTEHLAEAISYRELDRGDWAERGS